MDERLTEDLPFKLLRRKWQPVSIAEELKPGQVKSFVLLDTELVIARLGTGFLVAENSCPHKGAKLSIGKVCGDRLQCAYHGWQFDREGFCMNIPSLIDPP
jgi:phenylpropionate dioxygenase-like ring-hydroxylating dioxygenase large terminal subunit